MILAAAALALSAARLPPIDQCAGDPTFVRFRSELLQSIQRRDSKALLALVADDVMADFDGATGRREFARIWKLDGPAARKSPLWNELRTVIGLGCSRIDVGRMSPSLIGQVPDVDQFETFLAMREAKLRRSPSYQAHVVATLNYHLVAWRDEDAPDGWLAVSLSDGRHGFVRRDQIRAALDYRAQFGKVHGRWRMVSFVQGD